MSLIKDLLEKPSNLPVGSKYTAMNCLLSLRYWSPSDCLPGRDPNSFHGSGFCWTRRSALRSSAGSTSLAVVRAPVKL